MVGIPWQHQPANHATVAEFWQSVNHYVGAGILPGARRRILEQAQRDYPDNPIFARAVASLGLLASDREIGEAERARHRPVLRNAVRRAGLELPVHGWTVGGLTALCRDLVLWSECTDLDDDSTALVTNALHRLRALIGGLQAWELLLRLGVRSLRDDFLVHLYWRTVSAMPEEGASLLRLLILAASVRDSSPGPVKVALARFVVAIASYLDVPPTQGELAKWLDDLDIRAASAAHFLWELGKPSWLLIDFGDEQRTPPGPLRTVPRARDVRLRGVLYAPGRSPRQMMSQVTGGPQEALKDLMRQVRAERRVVVDLALPTDLLTKGVEHWEVVPNGDRFDRLSAVCATRLRWSLRLHHTPDYLRPPASSTEMWVKEPCILTQEIIADRGRLNSWLDEGAHLRYPYVIAGATDVGFAPLQMLLSRGSCFIVWLAPGADVSILKKIETIGASLPPESRRFGLPERIFSRNDDFPGVGGDTGPTAAERLSPAERLAVTFIWDDPDGRDGYTDFLADFLLGLGS
jgi:hypothetical protein